jgi:UDP-N-acetylglucosamine--N-acetylmuramyl-(pentapeptide) pyrophosphoryl-undecaprenol N-acetylglucosamine transferase
LRGNPVRPRILTAEPARALKAFDLDPSLPLLLATGGGTGALALNRIVAEATPELVRFCQVLHLTGRGRGVVVPDLGPRYLQREFLTDLMPHALAAATLVISRAGMATLTELAALGKAAIVVPMPRSHQEANAVAFAAQKAAVTIDEATLSPTRLVELVRGLLGDDDRRARLRAAMASAMPRDAADRIADDLLGLLDDDLD